jgi:hypothetical protein
VLGTAGLLALLAGCGVQIAAGLAPPQGQRTTRATLELDGRLKLARQSGMFGGLGASLADPGAHSVFALRELALTAGYHFAWSALALELGPRLGLGAPVNQRFAGRGLHTALETALLVRLLGRSDSRAGYIPAAFKLDLVLSGRAGVWARPIQARAAELFDAQLALGLRFSLASDLTASGTPDWEPPR